MIEEGAALAGYVHDMRVGGRMTLERSQTRHVDAERCMSLTHIGSVRIVPYSACDRKMALEASEARFGYDIGRAAAHSHVLMQDVGKASLFGQ